MRAQRGALRAQQPHPGAIASARPAQVIACVDSSEYLESVCDHAAWFAGKVSGGLELLHVQERPAARTDWGIRALVGARGASESARLLARAEGRLTEQGVEATAVSGARGDFPEVAARRCGAADLVVLGRHGCAGAAAHELGPNVRRIIGRVAGPVCVAPKLFLPISRALVVSPPPGRDRRFADALAKAPYLDGVAISIAGLPETDERPAEGGRAAAAGPDIIVLPRAALLGAQGDRLIHRAAQRLLSSPLPVLVI
jgi:hypothetical protein